MSWISKMLDRLFVVIFAFVFLQIPLFMQQYQHQLRGHVSELTWQVEAMRDTAAKSHKTLKQYVQKFIKNEDTDIASQGQVMHKVVDRWEHLSEALKSLEKAPVLKRPWVFLYYLQYDIAKATFHAFDMGILLTFEGITYALFGMLFGYLLYQILEKIFRIQTQPQNS